ncbi:GDSL-type esterase/lipase family protein [Streptomyces sp. NPDC007095]|jgi:lysophospholipase L1-like esterase|uniref:GDSL-type esterase/lipase family protein n=1 Tax=Streptomyces sp. NPDC007095 TaxID=3154482 RepID=UPI0033DE3456
MPPLGSDTDDLRNTLLRVAGLSAADDEASDLERAEAEALRPVLWTVLSRFGQQIQRQNQRMRVSQFDLLGAPPHRVVFLGSSITEGGRWDEWFPELPTRNRGVGGDTVDDVAARLDSALNQPLKINLLIGANDLRDLVEPTGVDDIAARMERLVARIRTTVPQAPLYLNSVMPRAQVYATNVRALNRHYARIADRAGATYVDLWSALAGPDGALRPEFTLDELHLTGAGYRAWVEVLRPHLG